MFQVQGALQPGSFVSPVLCADPGGGAAGMRGLYVCSEALPELGQPLGLMIYLSGDSDYATLPKQRLKTILSIEKDHTVLGPHLQLLTGLQTGQRSHKAAAAQRHLRQLPHRWSSRR